MSAIGGPGGIGGPKGPSGSDRSELDAVDDAGAVDEVGDVGRIDTTDIDAITADLAAGKLTPHEAIEKLVDQIAGSEQLGPGERAELRELLGDLVTNDPYLASLVGRV